MEGRRAGFVTTRWSRVLAARGEAPEARAALEELCAAYWYPLYAFARRRGRGAEAAEDAVQAFLARAIEREAFAAADPSRGRFRSFLLRSFQNHLANEAEHDHAKKRGGGARRVSLDAARGEERLSLEPAHDRTPERLFERDFAVALLDRALASVRRAYEERGDGALFEALKGAIVGEESDARHRERAAALSMTEGAVKVAASRLRDRYRKALRAEIAETLAPEEDVDTELRALMGALGGL